MVDDAATIKDGTNENNTDIDRWADARRLRINGKACSKPWRSPNLRGTPCRSRGPYCRGHDMRLPLMMKPWRRPNLPRPLHRIALEWELIAGWPHWTPPVSSTIPAHVCEVRLRKDKRATDLVSNVLPFRQLWYGEKNATSNAVGYAQFYSRSHDAVIRVYADAGNVIETTSTRRLQRVALLTQRDESKL